MFYNKYDDTDSFIVIFVKCAIFPMISGKARHFLQEQCTAFVNKDWLWSIQVQITVTSIALRVHI